MFSQVQRLESQWQDVSELPVKLQHVELRCLYAKELVQSGLICLRKVLENLNPVDVSPPGNFWAYPQVVFPIVSP